MRKSDLLDELRAEIGDLSDRCGDQLDDFFQEVCKRMIQTVHGYQGVAVYMAKAPDFVQMCQAGVVHLEKQIRYGDPYLSVAAVRAGVYRELTNNREIVCTPFYLGQMVYGIFVIETDAQVTMDDDDITLFTEICSFFEGKLNKLHKSEMEGEDSL